MLKSPLKFLPILHDSELARDSQSALASLLDLGRNPIERFTVHVEYGEQAQQIVELPVGVLPLLTRLLAELAEGNAVALVPLEREVSTFEAADVLNVSRPYLIKLLEAGEIAFRRVGTHRRISLRDVLEYKRADDAKRAAILDDLVAEAQELGMGY